MLAFLFPWSEPCQTVLLNMDLIVWVAGGESEFKYFSQAAWMNKTSCSNQFGYKDGRLTVKQSGIYIVHSNVSYMEGVD